MKVERSRRARNSNFQAPGETLWESLYVLDEDSSYADPRLARDAPTRRLGHLLATWVPEHASVVELGCAASKWLPFLARERECRISGVDFSVSGLETARRIMANAGVVGYDFVCQDIADFVRSARDSHRTWDVVCSFGLVEHFDDLADIVRHHTELVSDGGHLILTFPRLHGINAAWVRAACPSVMTWHRPVDPVRVVEVIEAEGLEVLSSQGLGGVRLFAAPDPGPRYLPARIVQKVVNGAGEAADRIGLQYDRPVGQPFTAIVARR